ncbi:MAG: peptidase dimerization domain-containing protein, partial [Patescibacteria group bacterium]|nr:peptidase dimerization domain-containing protein [Patescibacteria group bacterium]
IGVKKIITQKNIPAKKQGKFIVMEPTEFKVMSGQAGLIMAKLITRGVAKHSSLKFKRSDDAVYNLINLLTTFYRKEWSAFNVVIEKGGEAPNIIASTAEATMNVRPKDSKEFKSILGFLKNFKRKNVELKITETAEPFKSSFFSKGETVSYLSEMGFFKNSLLFGVGSISQAHTKDEFVLRKDLNLLEEKLFNLIGQI